MAKPPFIARIGRHLSRPQALPGLVWKNVRFVFSNRRAKPTTGASMGSRERRPETGSESLRKGAKVFDAKAGTYGSDTTKLLHSIPNEVEEFYRQDLEEVLGAFAAYKSVLEVGSGNGIFTRLLDRWGCEGIIGTDISPGMLRGAQARLPQCRFELVTNESDPNLFPPATFDLIISRQLVCHLVDPIAVFECWKTWLKPGGRIAVIDGLWTRNDWGPPSSQSGDLVDDRPLSCTQTSATVSYLLSRANLTVKHRCLLNRVNGFAKTKYEIGQGRDPIFRFVIVASAELSP